MRSEIRRLVVQNPELIIETIESATRKLEIAIDALLVVVHGDGTNGPYSMMHRRRYARAALKKIKEITG